MATPIKMPELGESITEGTITRWLKQEGDHVETDEPLFEVSTDKVDTEVPSPVAGVLSSIKVHEDETVPVGTELAEIEPADATAGAASGDGQATPRAEAPPEPTEAPAEQAEAPAAEPAERAAEAPAAEPAERAAEAPAEGGEVVTVRMPELGESITEGTITRWLKQEGAHAETDEPLFEVSTDKVDTEVPSPVAGVLSSIKVHEDETVPVGTELAEIEPADATAGAASGDGQATPRAEAPPEPAEAPAEQAEAPAEQAEAPAEPAEAPAERAEAPAAQPAGPTQPPPAEQPRQPLPPPATAEAPAPASAPERNGGRQGVPEGTVVSPLVRRLAREHRIDLSQIRGSGAGGRVRREDVEAYLERRGAQPSTPAQAPATAEAEAPAAPPARALAAAAPQ